MYVQNASLEVAWSRTVDGTGRSPAARSGPWVTEAHEGFDLNHEADWLLLERLLGAGWSVRRLRGRPARRPHTVDGALT